MRPVCLAGGLALVLAGAGAGVTLASGKGGADHATAAAGGGHLGKHGHHGMHARGAGSGGAKAGIFSVRCAYSHSANDDPILMPGKSGASMLHDFFGNATTNASSTASKLIGGPTTCATGADASGYWTPALYDNGHRLTPVRMVNYWLGASKAGATAPLPAGLQMIVGNEQATSPQPTDRIYWDCHSFTGAQGTRNHGARTSAPQGCPSGQQMRLTIRFPSCWDGHTLSAVGQDNVVYPSGLRCPASHSVTLPRLIVHAFYPGGSSGKFTLSMAPGMHGSVYSEHADFLDGWNTSAIDRLIASCLDAHSKCGPVKGPNGTPHHQPGMTGST